MNHFLILLLCPNCTCVLFLQVFGALASEPFKVSDCFYGTGETFLFTFNPEFEVQAFVDVEMFQCFFAFCHTAFVLRPISSILVSSD